MSEEKQFGINVFQNEGRAESDQVMAIVKAFAFGFVFCVLGLCRPLYAEMVDSVDSKTGAVVLENGKRVFLAGIQLDEQGISILKVLISKQNLRLEECPSATRSNELRVLAYLNKKSLKFPPAANEAVDEKEVMLNEFLIRMGAAKVAEGEDFEQKKDFMKLQDEAQKRGEGIWSYVRL